MRSVGKEGRKMKCSVFYVLSLDVLGICVYRCLVSIDFFSISLGRRFDLELFLIIFSVLVVFEVMGILRLFVESVSL